MDFEIIEKQNDVTYEIPAVHFPAFDEYKEKAETVAEYIGSMEVSQENIKETKQTLAKARKLTDRLNRVRIDMKKDILKNYTLFEAQVKEIVSIVDDADAELRGKVKELEDAERNEKEQWIHELWNKRVQPFPDLEKVMPDAFNRWLSPKHLNKSTSLKTVETEMTLWIQKTLTEINTAADMGDEYLAMYGRCGNLAEAIIRVTEQKKAVEAIRYAREPEEDEVSTAFVVYGTKDINLTERLLKENEINYRKVI